MIHSVAQLQDSMSTQQMISREKLMYSQGLEVSAFSDGHQLTVTNSNSMKQETSESTIDISEEKINVERPPSRTSDDEGSCGRISPGGPGDEYHGETIIPIQPIPQRYPYNLSRSPSYSGAETRPTNCTTTSEVIRINVKSESEKSFPSVCHSPTPSPSSSPSSVPSSPTRSVSPYPGSPPLTPPPSSFNSLPSFTSSAVVSYPSGLLSSNCASNSITSGSSAFLPHPRRAMAAAAAAAAVLNPAAASHLLCSSSAGLPSGSSKTNYTMNSGGSSVMHYAAARLTPARLSSGRSGERTMALHQDTNAWETK